MTQQEINLNPSEFLGAALENFDRLFFADTREQAKLVFRTIEKGEQTPFMHIDLGDAGEINCSVALDASLYQGTLNFSNFRKALAMMLMGIKERLTEETDLGIMSSRQGDLMFNIPGIVKTADAVNIMVCGLRQISPGEATMRLMFIDPASYQNSAASNENNSQPPE